MFSIFTHVMKLVRDTNSEPRLPVVYEIIKDWIYIVTANGLSFVKNMFTIEVVIIHLPQERMIYSSFSLDLP